MKKSILSGSIRCSILLATLLGMAHAAPYGPDGLQIRWTQPNGSALEMKVFGDENYGRTETVDGYTVVQVGKTYYYATLSADGGALVSTGVGADQPAPAGLAKHLNLPGSVISQVWNANSAKHDAGRAKLWEQRVNAVRSARSGKATSKKAAAAAAQGAPFVGNKRGLTILAQFPNDPATPASDPIAFPTTRAKITNYCNQAGYAEDGNSGSVRDYFYDQSLKKLNYTQLVTPVITLPRPWAYYNWADYPANTEYRGDSGQALLRDALDVLVAQRFDFSSISLDGNGVAYATNIFFAGPNSNSWSNGLWPHMSGLGTPRNVGTALNPIYINRYQITNLENSRPVLGTFVHENGHLILGYPDLYDYGPESQGAGLHCVMASGSFNNGGRTPSPINAFFKDMSGWANVTEMQPAQFRTLNLPTTGNRSVRVRKPGTPTEYFMVENRGRGDKWAEHNVDKGIVIWHIDERVSGNSNEQMTPTQHYMVSVEQADGQFHLENNINGGDQNDLFDLLTPNFNDDTLPNANWWDGTRSAVEVRVLSATGPSTRVLIGSVPPDTIILDSPNGGEVLYPASKFPVAWRANITGNVRIDLLKGGLFHSAIAMNEKNSGKFIWELPASLPPGKDYAVRIRSLTNAKPTSDISQVPFEVSAATFPPGNAMPYGWHKPKNVHSGWTVSKSPTYEGSNTLVSKAIQDGRRAGVAYTSHFKKGTLSFFMKVSSEDQFDFARFYIDGELMALNGEKGVSGDSDWTYYSFPVSAGRHTFMWIYEKDDSYGEMRDCVWLDGVSMPPGTQKISVQKPVGVEHSNAASTTHFADTTMESSSANQTFTIKNRGKADLADIKVSVTGANRKDFVVTAPGKKNLGAGASTTFKVRFTPKSAGLKRAAIRIVSNDSNEGNFIINLRGTGLGLPKIVVSQPAAKPLKDNVGSSNFGFAPVRGTGKSKVFTIRNAGSVVLSGLGVSKSGPGRNDFRVGALGATSLQPGQSTTIKITFSPKAKNVRRAVLSIRSNDKKTGTFEVAVHGTGAPRVKSAVAASAVVSPSVSGGIVEAVLGKPADVPVTTTGVEVVGGTKYLSLTVAKIAGADPGTVEVSSNLLDWYSGTRHTTILVDDAKTLKVRDNTPVAPGQKRHIRLK